MCEICREAGPACAGVEVRLASAVASALCRPRVRGGRGGFATVEIAQALPAPRARG